MPTHLQLICVLVAMLCYAPVLAAGELSIPGDTYRDLAPKSTGGAWLALHTSDGKWVLSATSVTVRAAPRSSEFEVTISSSTPKAKYLIRNVPLAPGNVTVAAYSSKGARLGAELLRSPSQRHTLSISLQDKRYRLEADFNHGTITLEHEGARQTLFRFPKGPMGGDPDNWALAWAGDLEGDTKLDLILEVSDHQRWYESRLFLSSVADSKKFVAAVAATKRGF